MKTHEKPSGASERDAFDWLRREYRGVADHLSAFEAPLKKRQDKGRYWWELRSCDYYEYLDAPKIIFPDICKSPRFHLDRTGIYLANTAYCLGTDDLYLLGILNSRLFWFAISNISIPFGVRAGEYRYRLIYQYMEKVPVRVIDQSVAADRARHQQIVRYVEQTLALHKSVPNTRTPQEKSSLQRQIAALDTQIDRLIYELYNLTPAEVAIVEGSTSKTPEALANLEADSGSATDKSFQKTSPTPNPDQAWADAAHFYAVHEETPPYLANVKASTSHPQEQ